MMIRYIYTIIFATSCTISVVASAFSVQNPTVVFGNAIQATATSTNYSVTAALQVDTTQEIHTHTLQMNENQPPAAIDTDDTDNTDTTQSDAKNETTFNINYDFATAPPAAAPATPDADDGMDAFEFFSAPIKPKSKYTPPPATGRLVFEEEVTETTDEVVTPPTPKQTLYSGPTTHPVVVDTTPIYAMGETCTDPVNVSTEPYYVTALYAGTMNTTDIHQYDLEDAMNEVAFASAPKPQQVSRFAQLYTWTIGIIQKLFSFFSVSFTL